MVIYRARVFDTPNNPFSGGELRAASDVGLAVLDGRIVARADVDDLRARYRHADVVDLRAGILLPGMIDTHVHFPQVRAIGHLGKPLLDWLDQSALPEEIRLQDAEYSRAVATDFITGLVSAGTTTALVFGSHFATAVDALFAEADRVGLRITSGLVTSDRILPEPLLTTAERANAESRQLIERWHGKGSRGDGRLRFAITPRFALSASAELMAESAKLFETYPDLWFTSHVNENKDEVASVADLFPDSPNYSATYAEAGLLSRRAVLAHNVHPTDDELDLLAETGTAVAHCATSNSALASGFFPMVRHLEHGVRIAFGSDVGAGTGFSLFKEGVQSYFMQQLSNGYPLTAAHLLHLATSAGAEVLGLADQVGDLSEGKRFDAVWLRPAPGEPLDVGIRTALSDNDVASKIFAMGTPADVAKVWVDGEVVHERAASLQQPALG